MTVELYVKIVNGGEVMRLALSDAVALRDWLNRTLPEALYSGKKK
jgi:hypothetical protein